jgi:hypothetical protein
MRASLETLQQMFEDNKILSTTEHNAIINRIDNIDKKFSEKICDLEKSSDEFQAWKSYAIAIVALISFFVPIGLYALVSL